MLTGPSSVLFGRGSTGGAVNSPQGSGWGCGPRRCTPIPAYPDTNSAPTVALASTVALGVASAELEASVRSSGTVMWPAHSGVLDIIPENETFD